MHRIRQKVEGRPEVEKRRGGIKRVVLETFIFSLTSRSVLVGEAAPRQGFSRHIVVICLLLGLLCCREETSPTDVNPPVDTKDHSYRIAFVSDRDVEHCFQLYVMNGDGSNQTRLTDDGLSYYNPRFSPDGTKIVFYSSTYDNTDDIYIIDADGSNHRSLTNTPGNDDYPRFSPDGSQIVFTSDRDGNREIYIMDSDGGRQQRLTANSTFDHAPLFSPDGLKIIFYSIDDSWNYDLYTIEPDGSNLTGLTDENQYRHAPLLPHNSSFSVYFHEPRYSPDGSKIAFASYSPAELDYNIYIMNSDGSQQTRLTAPNGYHVSPQFSPDGSKLLFMTHRGDNYDIYSMNLDGTNQIPLYDSQAGHALLSQPSPDGSKILLTDDNVENGVYKIYIMNSDRSEISQLTQGSYQDLCPLLQPTTGSTVTNRGKGDR